MELVAQPPCPASSPDTHARRRSGRPRPLPATLLYKSEATVPRPRQRATPIFCTRAGRQSLSRFFQLYQAVPALLRYGLAQISAGFFQLLQAVSGQYPQPRPRSGTKTLPETCSIHSWTDRDSSGCPQMRIRSNASAPSRLNTYHGRSRHSSSQPPAWSCRPPRPPSTRRPATPGAPPSAFSGVKLSMARPRRACGRRWPSDIFTVRRSRERAAAAVYGAQRALAAHQARSRQAQHRQAPGKTAVSIPANSLRNRANSSGKPSATSMTAPPFPRHPSLALTLKRPCPV